MVELHEFLVPHLNELAVTQGFAPGYTFSTSITGAGDGFVSLMLRVVINGLRNGANDSFAVVVKMPPDSPERRQQFSAVLLFEREASFYDKYWPMLVQFQADRGITTEEAGFFAVPKCYNIVRDLEHDHYAMIMEDLIHSGYDMFNKMDVIDVDHVTIFVRHLARYHALSFAMRDQQPDMFREIQSLNDMFSETMMKTTPNFELMLQAAIDKAIMAVDPHKEFKIEKLQKLRGEAIKILEFCGTLEKCEPYGVLMHGDCWNNNMMYRYGGDRTPDGIRLLDFQLLRYGSPALDLAYFIFTSTNEELRDQHYENLLLIYHQTLTEYVDRLGSDGAKVFPFRALKAQMRKFGRYGLVMATFLIQMLVVPKQDLPDMDQIAKDMAENKIDLENMAMMQVGSDESDRAYKKRMNGVVRDIIRLGYY